MDLKKMRGDQMGDMELITDARPAPKAASEEMLSIDAPMRGKVSPPTSRPKAADALSRIAARGAQIQQQRKAVPQPTLAGAHFTLNGQQIIGLHSAAIEAFDRLASSVRPLLGRLLSTDGKKYVTESLRLMNVCAQIAQDMAAKKNRVHESVIDAIERTDAHVGKAGGVA